MVYKKKMMKKRTVKKKTVKKRVSSKPIGYVKEGSKYKLVFGSKSKPRLGKNSYKSKASLLSKAKSLLK